LFEEVIRYYDDSSWKKYFSVDLADLYSSVEGLLLLRSKLEKELTSDAVSNLISRSNVYREILFGGLRANEPAPFVDNSLALFYRDVLGIGLKEDDVSLVITRIKEGLTLESATEKVYCVGITTLILERLRELSSKLKSIYKSLRGVIEEPKPKEYELKTSNVGVEAFLDVLNAGRKLLPLYNPISFFIMSLYSVPKFYVLEAYPQLFEENVLSLLKKYGMHIVKLLEPDLPDEKIRSERAVVGLEDNCVGCLIREVILDVYSLFQIDILKRFFAIEDEFNKYIETYASKLKESIVVDRFMHVINTVSSTDKTENYDSKERCKVHGYQFYYSFNFGATSSYRGRVVGGEVRIGYDGRYKLNYTEFFAFLAPQMFSGLAYVRPVGAREFMWLCTLGWEK